MKSDKEAIIPTLQQQDRMLQDKRRALGLEQNFRLFNDFLKFKQASYTKTTIILVITFLHQSLSLLRQYKTLIKSMYTDQEYTIVNQIVDATQYVDIQGLLRIDITVFYILFSLALCFTIGLASLYGIIFLLGTQYKAKKKFIGKLWIMMAEYYQWVAYFPTMVILLEYINCNSTLDCTLNLGRIIGLVFAGLGVFCGLMNIFMLSLFFQNNGDNKKDSMNCENPIYIALYNFYRALLALLICIKTDQYAFLWFFILFSLSGYLGFMLNLLFGIGHLAFATNYTRLLFLVLINFCVAQTLAMLIDELYRQDKLTQENFSLFFLFSFVFIQIGVYNLANVTVMQIEFDMIKISENTLHKQIYLVQSMLEQSSTDIQVDTFFKGTIQRHLEFQCQHVVIIGEGKCFCKKKSVYDSKKRKEALVINWMNNKSIFVKFLIKSWIEVYSALNPNKQGMQILYARFVFTKFRNHQIALFILSRLEKQFTFILDRYQAYLLQAAIIKHVKHINRDSFKSRLEIENALFVEEQIDQVKSNISDILKENCSFWQLLQQQTIDLEEMDNKLKAQFDRIDITKDLWISITSYLDYKKKWKFYYAWFTLYILNKKIKNRILDNFQGLQVNENDIFSEEIQENNLEDDIASVKSTTNLDQDKIEIKSKKIVFDKKACIIQTNDDPNALIVKVNKQFTKIFGYKKEETINLLTISALMPEVFSKVHPDIMQDYKFTGKSTSLYSQRKIYCIHKTGYMFTAWKFIKIYVDLHGQSQFVVMIRPTDYNNDKKHDFIIVDQDWEINGITQNIIQTLQLDSDILQKKSASFTLINLLLFAPKLIQFSKVARFIKEPDLKAFGMVRNKDGGTIKQPLTNQNSLNPKINIMKNSMNSGSLQVFQHKISMYSEVELNSKNFIPQQSLDNPETENQKQLIQQVSSSSDKNEFQEFQSQLGQVEQMQNGLTHEMTLQAQHKLQMELKEQYKSNLVRIQTEKGDHENETTQHDEQSDQSNDEKFDFVAIKNKLKSIHLEEHFSKSQNLTFHLKLPDSFIQACHYYTGQKTKLYQIKVAEDELVKQREQQDLNKNNKKELYVKQGTSQREFRKKARLMFAKAAKKQLDDQERNYYELILEIYQKYLQDGRCKKFKLSCSIKFIKVKTEKVGIIKVIGLSEVQKVRVRRTQQRPSFIMPKLGSKSNELFIKYQSGVSKQNETQNFQTMTSDESKVVSPMPQKHFVQMSQKPNGLGYQLQSDPEMNDDADADDKDMLLESKTFKKMINWETFQHQFKMQQGSQSFSLNYLDNIFRKEDNNKPRKFLVKIAYLTWFLRLMFLTIISLNLLTYFYKPFTEFQPIKNESSRIFELSQMQVYMIEVYDTVLDLLIYQDFDYQTLNVNGTALMTADAFYTYEQGQIDIGYNFLKGQMNDINQQETFLDPSLYAEFFILDDTIKGSINVSLELDQKDFLTKFLMLEHSISQFNNTELQELNADSPTVRYFRFITVPYLYNLMNDAVLKLQELLLVRSSDMVDFILIILILEMCIFVVGFIGLLFIILWICQTYKAVLLIFIRIKKHDLTKIVKQQQFIQTQFKYLTIKDDEINGLIDNKFQRMNSVQSKSNFQQQNFLLINEEDDQNVNKKKEKNIIERNLLRVLTYKMSIAYIVLVLLTAAASLTFFLTLQQAAKNIGSVITAGESIISDFSDSQLLMIALKERLYDSENYSDNLYGKIESILTKQLSDAKATPTISNPNYGVFYESFEQVYFNNLCEYLLAENVVDSVTYADCESLCYGKLGDGIIAFNQYYTSSIQDLILDQESRFGQVGWLDVWAYNSAIDYIKSAYKTLITNWSQDLASLIDENQTLILILLIVMLIFQLFVFIIIAELYLVNQLNHKFQFYRQVYKFFMPNDIIQKEKIIRAQLIKYNIIKK